MHNKFFDIQATDESPHQSLVSYHSKYLCAHYEKIKHTSELSHLPEREEFIFLQTENQFNAFTFIPAILEKYNIEKLYAATYSINKRVIQSLVELHDKGRIEQITLCISDSLIKRNPKTIDILKAYCSNRANIKVIFAWNHAKVAMMETINGHYIVEGSGNWSENAHYEQYLFANSPGLYEFRKKLFNEVNIRYEIERGTLRSH